MTWKIIQIFDGDYGCEELAPGESPKMSVTIENENGERRRETVRDAWLIERGLDVGSAWPDNDWPRRANKKTVDIPAFIKKMQAVKAGQDVEWNCPFCGGKVILYENLPGHTTIGCADCDMRINLDSN